MPQREDRDRRALARTAPVPAEIKGRVPAHDLDREAEVLSSCFLKKGVLREVRDVLAPECFYSDANGRIFEGMCAVEDAGMPVDTGTVSAWLRDRGRFEAVGGARYIAQLVDATPAVAHVMAHAQIVFDKWRLRAGTALCQITAAEAYGDVGDSVQAFLDAHIAAMNTIATRNAGKAIAPLGDGMMERLQADWERAKAGASLMGIRTGFHRLDHKLTGLSGGNLYIVAARPGMGKTSLALGAAVNIVYPEENVDLFSPPIEYGVAVFSLEMPKDQLQQRMVCTEARVALSAYRLGQIGKDEWKRLFDSGAWLAQLPIWIDDTSDTTVAQIRAKSRQLATRWCRPAGRKPDGTVTSERKLGAVVVDYLQLVKPHTPGRTREEEVAAISKALKDLAKALDVPVIALSQLNRSVETRTTKDKRPQLSDLRDSGAVEQDADAVIFIYRDEYYNPEKTEAKGIAELIVAKQRNGSTGRVLASFDAEHTRFGNLDSAAAAAYAGGDDE